MAILLSDLLEETEEKYELQLIAGANGLKRELNWVYVAEDQSNAGFLRTGELIISTCSQDAMLTVSQFSMSGLAMSSHPSILLFVLSCSETSTWRKSKLQPDNTEATKAMDNTIQRNRLSIFITSSMLHSAYLRKKSQ